MAAPVVHCAHMNGAHAVTRILEAVSRNERGAREQLLDLVYHELHRMAWGQVAREPGRQTLRPTALVNEAWIRLFGPDYSASPADVRPRTPHVASLTESRKCPVPEDGAPPPQFKNRRHFFAAAAEAMHRICVDYARKRRAAKRGGGARPAALAEEPAMFDHDPDEVLSLHEALAKLGEQDPQLVELVRLRYFMELGLDETAAVLGVSRRTVAYRWRLARAWLYEALRDR